MPLPPSLFALALWAACVSGCGQSDGLSIETKADRTLDLSGSEAPADITTPENAAKAAVATIRVVVAASTVIGELGDAVGDLFPEEDNPCPGGGSASSDLGGSFSSPRLDMRFADCVRGEAVLDGFASITCDDFDGSSCSRGRATLGEGGDVLHFQNADGVILMRGQSQIVVDESARRLQATASFQGERRSWMEDQRYSFITENLNLDIQEVADDRAEVRINGVVGVGGDTATARCLSGRFDNETAEQPLILEGAGIQSGLLRVHSPPPRPGTQQGTALFEETGATAQGANGAEQFYTAEELALFCAF